jgi:hypothetical protein
MPKITGTTSCDSAVLLFTLSCNGETTSIESGRSYDGVFEHSFVDTDCKNPSITVSIK